MSEVCVLLEELSQYFVEVKPYQGISTMKWSTFYNFIGRNLLYSGQQLLEIEPKKKRAFLPIQFFGLGGFNDKKIYVYIIIQQ